MKNVTQARVLNCVAPAGTYEFLHLKGEKNKEFRLFNNDFSAAQRPFGPRTLIERAIVHSIGNHMPE